MATILTMMLLLQTQPYPDVIDYSKGIALELAGPIQILKGRGYAIDEAGMIQALQDPLVRDMAGLLLRERAYLKVDFNTPAIAAALEKAFNDATREKNESDMDILAATLLTTAERGWVIDAVAALPLMKARSYQARLAQTLAFAGRGEGWPYVRDEVASGDAQRIYSALGRIDKFDGLANPLDGGQPIDVARELHQLATTTPDNVTWPTIVPESQRQRSKDYIEAKAQQIDKAKAEKRQ